MRTLLILSLSLVFILSAHAQDSTAYEKPGVISTLRQKINALKSKANLTPDTVKNIVTTFSDTLNLPSSDSLSLKQDADSVANSLSLPDKFSGSTDSLRNTLATPSDILGQQRTDVQGTFDTLRQNINRPLNAVKDGVSSAGESLNKKLGTVQDKVTGKTGKLESQLQQSVSRTTDGEVKLPDQEFSIPGTNVGLPSSSESLTDVGVAGRDLSLPTTDAPGIDLLSKETDELKLPKENLDLNALKEKATIDIPATEEIKEVTGKLSSIDSKLAEAGKYEKELQQIKQGDLSQTENISKKAEEKLANLDEVKAATGETVKITQQQAEYEALIQRYRDKKLLQEEILRKSKDIANDKLNKFSPAVTKVQDEISKAQKLNSSVQKFEEVKNKLAKERIVKPLRERLLPGITIQAYNSDIFTIDWAAQISYKLTSKLTIGAGGIYRIEVGEELPSWINDPAIYGYRTYMELSLFKGFYGHGEFESLHVGKYFQPSTGSEIQRHHVYNGNFGIGRGYDISKKIKGSILVFYKVTLEGYMPAASKINLRVGFDYNMKKRKRLKGLK